MNHRHKKSIINLVVVLSLTLGVAACGGGSTTTTDSTTKTDTTTDNGGNTGGGNGGNTGGGNGGNTGGGNTGGGNGGNTGGGNAGGVNPNGPTTISFIELNDLHANLVPHWDQKHPVNGQQVSLAKRGGLARIAVKIKEIRDSNPNSILMSIGDVYHGGAEGMFSVGNDIVGLVDLLGIDVGVPGNWDFAYGPIVSNARFGLGDGAQLRADVLVGNFPFLGANVKYKTPDYPSILFQRMGINLTAGANRKPGDNYLAPTHVITKNGVKIGFIGLTSDIVLKMHQMMALNTQYTEGLANYITLIEQYSAELKTQNVDYIVVMSELGIQKDYALAKSLNKSTVNIFFSAHTHELTETMRTTPTGVVVVESGNDTYLGQMDVQFDSSKNIVSHTWKIHQIDSTIDTNTTEGNQMTAAVALIQKRFIEATEATAISIPQIAPIGGGGFGGAGGNFVTPQTFSNGLNVALGQTSVPLERISAVESSFNNAYTDLLRQYAKTDLALTPGFRFDATVIPNNNNGFTSNFGTPYTWQRETAGTINTADVTTADVYRFLPAPYYVATGTITADQLKSMIELILEEVFSTDAFMQNGGWFMGFSGLNMIVDLKKPDQQRVISIDINGMSVVSNGVVVYTGNPFTVAGCSRPLEVDITTTLCGYPGKFANVVVLKDAAGVNYSANDFLIDQLKAGNVATLTERKSITDISKTKMWPDTMYVQPLEGAAKTP